MGLFDASRDPLRNELRRLEREVRELEEKARRLESGLGPEPPAPPPQPPVTRITFADAEEPAPNGHPGKAPSRILRIRQRQIKLQVFAMGVVCLILGILVARVLGWM